MPSLAIGNANSVIISMAEVANKNYESASRLLNNFDEKAFERIKEREDIIDKMEERTTKYLVTLLNSNLRFPERFPHPQWPLPRN